MYHKRHKSWEAFDEITFRQEERYKTSGLSGDEWRFSIVVSFISKGEVVHRTTFGSMEAALLMIGAEWLRAQEPISDRVIEIEQDTCSQPACREKPIGRFRIKRQTADDGHFYDVEDVGHLESFRAFCAKHVRRGDCSREDCDENYEPLDGATASDSTNKQESPSSVILPDGTLLTPPTSDAKA
jgi:hypothetical protein